MKKVLLFICSLLILCITHSISADDLTARQIIDKSDENSKISGAESISTMTIIDAKGRKRVRKIAQVTKLYGNGETEKKLVRFLSPPDVKGTGLLTYDYEKKDDDMWLFMPAFRKTRRIVSSEKSKSFMGSEFSYSDMAPPVWDEFTFKKLGEETVRNEPCYKISIVPNSDDIADENGFSKRVSYISKKDFVARRSIYYDLDGELHKEMTINKVKKVDEKNNKYRPVDLIMVNKQNGRKSTLLVEKIVVSESIKDEYFTIGYLEKQ